MPHAVEIDADYTKDFNEINSVSLVLLEAVEVHIHNSYLETEDWNVLIFFHGQQRPNKGSCFITDIGCYVKVTQIDLMWLNQTTNVAGQKLYKVNPYKGFRFDRARC